MIVNFFAPWCHWCQRLEPVWEKTATKEHTKHPLDTDKTIVLAKVDCTGRDSESLCIKHRIDAFPTIMVFRKDDKATPSTKPIMANAPWTRSPSGLRIWWHR